MEATDLKKAGLKATLPRIRILQILEESEGKHLSAEDVYKILLGKTFSPNSGNVKERVINNLNNCGYKISN